MPQDGNRITKNEARILKAKGFNVYDEDFINTPAVKPKKVRQDTSFDVDPFN